MKSAAGRQAMAGTALTLAIGSLGACGSGSPDPAGSGGLVGHMSGTSDVEGQPGDPAVRGGALAVIPITAMDGQFWELTGAEPIANPQAWKGGLVLRRLSQAQVSQLDGETSAIDADGDFRLHSPPGEYAVCYWPIEVGGRVTGCDEVELTTEGELEASFGEAGFHISVVD